MAFSSDWEGATYANHKTHQNIYLADSVVAIIDRDWPGNAVIATKCQLTRCSPLELSQTRGRLRQVV